MTEDSKTKDKNDSIGLGGDDDEDMTWLTHASLTIVVVGASGDLAKKKTYPSLLNLYHDRLLPSDTVIWGYARSRLTDDELRDRLRPYLRKQKNLGSSSDDVVEQFLQLCRYHPGKGYGDVDAFQSLSTMIATHEEGYLMKHSAHKTDDDGGDGDGDGDDGGPPPPPPPPPPQANRLFYFAIPPNVFAETAVAIKKTCMQDESRGFTRLIVEKPFGRDLDSFEELNRELSMHFTEDHIYRIDHYLGKEMVQNLTILRFSNTWFERVWNSDCINCIILTFKENFGTEGRGGYFDQFGIIRDILQNHLLQVLTLLTMEPPTVLDGPGAGKAIRDAKVSVLNAIPPLRLDDVVLGQYEGYADDPTITNKDTNTPTYAMIKLSIHTPRWYGVPIIMKAGKALDEKKAEMRIQFKDAPAAKWLFQGGNYDCPRNELVLRLQPHEAVYMKTNVKRPGFATRPVQSELEVNYDTRFTDQSNPDAYTRLILDVLRGKHAAFVRDDELRRAWEIFTPLLRRIETERVPPVTYPQGSRGPVEADRFIRDKVGFTRNEEYTYYGDGDGDGPAAAGGGGGGDAATPKKEGAEEEETNQKDGPSETTSEDPTPDAREEAAAAENKENDHQPDKTTTTTTTSSSAPPADGDVGLWGLAVMGQNFALNMASHGFRVVVGNRSYPKVETTVERAKQEGDLPLTGSKDAADFCSRLRRPRKIILLVQAGKAVDDTIQQLSEHMHPGDVLIDGGNEWFPNTIRRSENLRPRGIHFVGMGISGGEEGARNGPSLMPGGPRVAYDLIEPILSKCAAQVEKIGPCAGYLGPVGSGNYVKMVHNGIEYGDMQLIAEVYDVLRNVVGMSNEEMADLFEEWNKTELSSYLIEITHKILRKKDDGPDGNWGNNGDDYVVDYILDKTGMKGTGRWTIQEAAERSVAAPTMAAALDVRMLSGRKEERVVASKVLVAHTPTTAPPPEHDINKDQVLGDLKAALYASKICSYAQGMSLIRAASDEFDWRVDLSLCARLWMGGCIIRAELLGKIHDAFRTNADLPNLLLDPFVAEELNGRATAWRRVVSLCVTHGVACPSLCGSLMYFDTYRRARLPANLTQAQRDFFGGHTYERIDDKTGGRHHTAWTDAHHDIGDTNQRTAGEK